MPKKLLAIIFLFSLTLAFNFETSAKTIFKNRRYPYVQNERFVLRALRTLHSAEATYQSTTGNGQFGSLVNLRQAELIDSALSAGDKYGYYFTLILVAQTATTPARFYLTATARRYRKTGRKSFYVDETGVIRGADKQGAAANDNDPPIDEN